MNNLIETIVKGSEIYFRAFALASNMYLHEGDIEWIIPNQGEKGPAIVYKVQLSDTAEEVISALVPDLQAGKVPDYWVLTPLSGPDVLADILVRKGFKDITDNDEPQYGMALDMNELCNPSKLNNKVEIRKVKTLSDFAAWVNIANTALHRCEILSAEHFAIWLEQKEMDIYLGIIDGVPVSTAATISSGKTASLEFVSTLEEYRNQGIAFTVCFRALQALQARGTEYVTLRCEFDVYKLYEKMGFKPYYKQRLFIFPRGCGAFLASCHDGDCPRVALRGVEQ